MKKLHQAYLYINKELVKLENYLINKEGTIVSTWRSKPRNLKTRIVNGYVKINLKISGKWMTCEVHRILASTFIPNPDKKETVNHINGIKTCNKIENLEWNTYLENNTHARKNNLVKKVEQHALRKLSDDDVRYIREKYKPYDKKFGRSALARKFNVDNVTIYQILQKITYKDVE